MTESSAMGHLSVPRRITTRPGAFTLIELLVASVVLIALLGIILMVTSSVGTTIARATARLDAFAAARSTFDLITKRLGQAVLNPYYEYFDAQGRPPTDPYYSTYTGSMFVPTHYGRQSDLQFLVQQNTQMPGYGQEVFFAAPLAYGGTADNQAMPGLLNACGFFVQYGGNSDFLPATVNTSHARYRLMQALQVTERLQIFPSTAQGDAFWLTDLANASGKVSRSVSPMAENVLVLTIWPRLSESDDPTGSQLTGNYSYNSHPPATDADSPTQSATANQLPPVVQVTMVVISEASAVRLAGTPAQPPAATERALQNTDGSYKFSVSTTAQHQADLDDLAVRLSKQHVDYEIFTVSIPMRESCWSARSNP